MKNPPPLPCAPDDVSAPTLEWPTGDLAPDLVDRLERVREALFGGATDAGCGSTSALLIARRGRLLFEHYGDGITRDDRLRSWSIAKSFVHALVGLLVQDQRLELASPAPVAAWQSQGDFRSDITIEHLLRMTDGLAFQEAWLEGRHNDVIAMIYQDGKQDTAAYARARPAAHRPGTHWNYSSGATNILCEILGRVIGGGREGVERFLATRLFEPIGMRSALPKFDSAGTFIGSSFLFATARDFLRFGLLYLRDGVWDGRRILPGGWVDHARTPTPASQGAYGAHWWLGRGGADTFEAVGYEGQYLILDPTRDLIVLRLGASTPDERERVEAVLRKLIADVPTLADEPEN